MRSLVKSLANSLMLDDGIEPAQPTPTVYTTAICSAGDLKASLAGIVQLTSQLGFTLHPETLYAPDGHSTTYHADHDQAPVALAVACHARRGTVSLAVSGLDSQVALTCFNAVERALFGDC